MNLQLRHSLKWQMIGPIPLMVIGAVAAIWFIVPRKIADNATKVRDHAVRRADHGSRFRNGHRAGNYRPYLRYVLHHQVSWNGDGAFDLSINRRSAWWEAVSVALSSIRLDL